MDKKPAGKPRRWLQGILVTLAGVLLALAGMFFTRNLWITALIERYGGAGAGMHIEVRGLAAGLRLRADEIVVTDPARPEPPLARVQGLVITPALLAGYTLAIEEVAAQRVEVDYRAGDTAAPDSGPGTGGARRGRGGGDRDRWLPYVLRVGELRVAAETAQGKFSAGPLAIEARLRPSRRASLRITGSPALHAEGSGLPAPIDATGPVSIEAERGEDGVQANVRADLPGVLQVEAALRGEFERRNANIEATLAQGALEGAFWSALLSGLTGTPVAFERIEAAPGAVLRARMQGGLPQFESASAALSTRRLRIGPESAPWLDTPLALEILPGKDGGFLSVSLRAGPEVAVEATLAGLLPPKLEVTFRETSAAALAKAVPALAGVQQAVPGLGKVSAKSSTLIPLMTTEYSARAGFAGVDAPLELAGKFDGPKRVLTASAKLGAGTSLVLQPFTLGGDRLVYSAAFDLMEAGPALGLAGWGGTVEAKGTLAPMDARMPGNVEVTLLNVVSDHFSLPYDVPLKLSAAHSRDATTGGFGLKDVRVELGEQARASAATVAAWPNPGAAGVEIGLTPAFLATQGLLDGGEGTIMLRSEAVSVASAPFRFEIDAATAILPEKLAALATIKGGGHLGWEGGLTADGTLAVGQLICAGAVLENATGTLRAENNRVIIDQIQGRLFGGAVAGTVSAAPLEEGFPMTLDARLEGGDLAVFTAQVQPPNVNVTGTVAGDVRVGLRGEEFTDLNIDLASGGGITINKDLVRQLLMSQQVAEATGSKTVGKVLEKIVGGEEQRPFDGAELKLGLADGRIAGTALLKSQALNLNVDIKADPGAVWEAIQSRGQVSFGDFTTR